MKIEKLVRGSFLMLASVIAAAGCGGGSGLAVSCDGPDSYGGCICEVYQDLPSSVSVDNATCSAATNGGACCADPDYPHVSPSTCQCEPVFGQTQCPAGMVPIDRCSP